MLTRNDVSLFLDMFTWSSTENEVMTVIHQFIYRSQNTSVLLCKYSLNTPFYGENKHEIRAFCSAYASALRLQQC